MKAANPADAASAVAAVGDALGQKVDAAKLDSLIAANAASKLSDEQIQKGIYNSIDANDYDGVIFRW